MTATVSRRGARTRVLRIARLGPCLPVAAIAARAGCHPSTAARHLRAAPRGRPRAAHDPICPPQLLAAMALNAARPAVASIAVRHPRCPAAALDRYADMMWGEWAHARVVAGRPARPATLGRFVRHHCRTTRTAAASNPATPPAALGCLAADRSATVRFGVLANRSCPPRLIERLAVDVDAGVHHAALADPRCPPSAVAAAATSRTASRRRAAAGHRACPPRLIERLARDVDAGVREQAAAAVRYDAELFAELADDDDMWVRERVAQRADCDPVLLDRLAADEQPRVRAAVAANPSTAAATLAALSHGDVAAVAGTI